MRQAMLHWNKKLANNKHESREEHEISNGTAEADNGSQAGARGNNEVNLPQRVKKPSPSKWSKSEVTDGYCWLHFPLLYIVLCYENFHFHVAHMYAHLGYPNAQHIVGQRYLK
ncbi:hypothetical protein E2320_007547, partial [Naja naja]